MRRARLWSTPLGLVLGAGLGVASTTGLSACRDDFGCSTGSEGCACLDGGTCADGLTCEDDVCVASEEDDGGDVSTDGDAGDASTGTTETADEDDGDATGDGDGDGDGDAAGDGDGDGDGDAAGDGDGDGDGDAAGDGDGDGDGDAAGDGDGDGDGDADPCGNGVRDDGEMCDGGPGCEEDCTFTNYLCNPLNNAGCQEGAKCKWTGGFVFQCIPFDEPVQPVGGVCQNYNDEQCEIGLACLDAGEAALCEGSGTGCCSPWCDVGDPTFVCPDPGDTCGVLFPPTANPPAPPGVEWLGFCGD